jgi:hypothetical protein
VMLKRQIHALALAVALAVAGPMAVFAQEPSDLAEGLSPRLLFVVSGGFWQTNEAAGETTEGEAEAPADAEPDQRGFYRALAIRSEDNSSRLYLQRIALTENGPELLDSTEITEVTERSGYITDIRPENSAGVSASQGFAAFIYIKDTPDAPEPDMLELFVDEFGELTLNGASN